MKQLWSLKCEKEMNEEQLSAVDCMRASMPLGSQEMVIEIGLATRRGLGSLAVQISSVRIRVGVLKTYIPQPFTPCSRPQVLAPSSLSHHQSTIALFFLNIYILSHDRRIKIVEMTAMQFSVTVAVTTDCGG